MTTADDDGDGGDDQTAADIVRKGLANLPRNDEDGVGELALIEYVAARLPEPDLDAIRHSRAVSAVRAQRNHRVTEADGQLIFPGMPAYDWEPERLVLSDDGSIVEQRRAKPKAKAAEASRAMRKAKESMTQAERRQRESSEFDQWSLDRIRQGARYAEDISMGAFVEWQRRTAA